MKGIPIEIVKTEHKSEGERSYIWDEGYLISIEKDKSLLIAIYYNNKGEIKSDYVHYPYDGFTIEVRVNKRYIEKVSGKNSKIN